MSSYGYLCCRAEAVFLITLASVSSELASRPQRYRFTSRTKLLLARIFQAMKPWSGATPLRPPRRKANPKLDFSLNSLEHVGMCAIRLWERSDTNRQPETGFEPDLGSERRSRLMNVYFWSRVTKYPVIRSRLSPGSGKRSLKRLYLQSGALATGDS